MYIYNRKIYNNILLFIILIVALLGIYIYYKFVRVNNEPFQDPEPQNNITTTSTNMTTNNITQYKPFFYAGYHEIYDYIISSTIIKHINNQIQLTSTSNTSQDVISFASIPRIYIYVSQQTPSKAYLLFTKLKKSDNLIRLYNKQLNQAIPDKDINKTVIIPNDQNESETERNSISTEQYEMVMTILKKYSFSGTNVDFNVYLADIKLYIQYMLLTNPEFMYNIVLSDTELKKLDVTREQVTSPNAGLSITLNEGIDKLLSSAGDNNKNDDNMVLFTTLFDGKELVPVFDNKIRDELMKQTTETMETTIKKYLFNNKLLATNISMDRIALFKMSIINPYQVNIFYILRDNISTGVQDELSNKELETKFGKVFTPNLSPEKLAKYAELYEANPKQKMYYNPDKECYVLFNKFQVMCIVLKKKESEL